MDKLSKIPLEFLKLGIRNVKLEILAKFSRFLTLNWSSLKKIIIYFVAMKKGLSGFA